VLQVVQEITAVNTHDGPITVAAHLKGAGYSGPKDLALQPGAHGVYPLTFTPPGIGTYQVTDPPTPVVCVSCSAGVVCAGCVYQLCLGQTASCYA
jgi:hypothetical protein